MPTLIQVNQVEKRYGEQLLLDEAQVALNDSDKVGLIGRNGSGKSTLCRILLGEEEVDAGEVVHQRGLRLGYLRQHDPFLAGETVHDFLIRDSQQPEWRCGEVAWRFRITDAMLNMPVDDLSGGWQTRVKLAALLLHDPNFLILDEPTNFLDVRTQMLLEQFLRDYRGGCLIVSHDRAFLMATCSHTLELARGSLTLFPGRVDEFLEHRAEREEHDRRVNATLATKKKQLETFIIKNRAQANTASQARSKAKQLARLETQFREIEAAEALVNLRLPQVERRDGTALRCERLAIGYPDHQVATQIQLDVDHGARVGVVGDNGQGKTTLLRTLTGSLEPLQGEFKWGFGCDVGVYAQHVYSTLPEQWTAREYLRSEATSDTSDQVVLDVAGSFLFSGETIEKRIRVLSGGERARLVLAGLLLSKHNVLLLDEPGNHLDVETLEALATAIQRFQGTLIFTSHDRHFMHRVATDVVEVRDGRVSHYPGSYDEYVWRIEKELAEGAREDSMSTHAAPPVAKTKEERKAQARADRSTQKRIAAIERKIASLDSEKRTASEKLANATEATEAQQLHDRTLELAAEIAALEEEWFELTGTGS